MYIMITEKCNMLCPHCCYSCGPGGENMILETFKKAIDFAEEDGDGSLCIGGGEPTTHPRFWEIFGIALGSYAYDDDDDLFIATNGSVSHIAMRLARMAKRGVIYAALSVDPFHEPIDDEVLTAFGYYDKKETYYYSRSPADKREMAYYYSRPSYDKREIRDVSKGGVSGKGKYNRAFENGLGTTDHCVCDDLFVDIKGNLFACGCCEFSMGTIWNPQIPEFYWELDEKCSNGDEFEEMFATKEEGKETAFG